MYLVCNFNAITGAMDKENVFKTCSCCGFEWKTRDVFLNDPNVYCIGYQANFEKLETGFFLFNHSCDSTLGISANDFIDLYSGQVFDERATGTSDCPGYCLTTEILDPCPVKCECAFIREIIQKIKN